MLSRLRRDPERTHSADWSDGFFNQRPLRFTAMSTTNPEDPLSLVPMVQRPPEYASAIFYLLRTTPCVTTASRGKPWEALSNRVAACEMCGVWHLLCTRKYSRYCDKACRWRAHAHIEKYGHIRPMALMQ